MGPIGIPELVLVFVILLLIFGGRKIPELARGLGTGIRNFKESLQGESQSESQSESQDEKKDKAQH